MMLAELWFGLSVFGAGIVAGIAASMVMYVAALTFLTRKFTKFAASTTIKLPPQQIFTPSKARSPFAPPLNDYELSRYNHLRIDQIEAERQKRKVLMEEGLNSKFNFPSDSVASLSASEPLPIDEASLIEGLSHAALSERGIAASAPPAINTPKRKGTTTGNSKSSKSGRIGSPKFRLLIHVIRANNLVATEKNGKSDPKIKFRVGTQKAKTRNVPNTLNPEFDQKLIIKIQDPERDRLTLRVFSRNKPQGDALVELKQLTRGKAQEMTVDLRGIAQNPSKEEVPATGSVLISLLLYNDEEDDLEGTNLSPRGRRNSAKDLEKTLKRREEKEKEKGKKKGGKGHNNKAHTFDSEQLTPVVRALPRVTIPSGASRVGDSVVFPDEPTNEDQLNELCKKLDSNIEEEDEEKSSSKMEEGFEESLRSEGTLQIRELKVWKERYFLLEEDKARLAYFTNEKKKSQIGLIDLQDCEVTIEADTSGFEKNEKKKGYHTLEIYSVARRHIFLSKNDEGTTLKLSKAHKLSWRCFLRSENYQTIQEWLYSLSVVMQRVQSKQGLFQIPSDVPMFSVPYLNLAIGRHFEDMRHSLILKNEIKRILGNKLALVQHPRLGPIVMEDFDLGPPLGQLFKGVRVTTSDVPNELLAEVDVDYQGELSIKASTVLTMKNAAFSIIVIVRILRIAGKLSVYGPPELHTQFFASFRKMPELDVKITLQHKNHKLAVTNLPKFRNWIKNAIENALRDRLVYPGRIKFHVPFPGRKIDIRIINAVAPPTNTPPPPPTESAEIEAKRFLMKRFFEELMNGGNYQVIDELFTADCIIHGTSVEGKQRGLAAVEVWVRTIKDAFPDIHFYVQDTKVEGYNVIVRWKGRGTNESGFLGYEASGEEMLFHGVTVSCIKHGNEKIVTQWHYYSAGTLLRRELNERENQKVKQKLKNELANIDLRALLGVTQGSSTRESVAAAFFDI